MKIIEFVGTFSLSLFLAFVPSISEASDMVWGESVGLVSATVSSPVDVRGAPVRSDPSDKGEILAYLPVGTSVQGEKRFSNGWVRLKSPAEGGWIELSRLKPRPYEGIVIKVGESDLCLPLKKGPDGAHENADCAQIGEMLKFSGVATRDGWLQLSDRKGWAPAAAVNAAALTVEGTPPEKPKPLASREATSPAHSPQEQVPPMKAQAGPPESISEKKDARKDESKGDAKACVGEWCVNFSNDTITRAGKPQSFGECARDDTCARILSEFWVAVLEDEPHVDIPISSSTALRLGKDGTIRSASSGSVFANCQSPSGPDPACIVGFLMELAKPIVQDHWKQSAGAAASDRPAETRSLTTSEPKKEGAAAAVPPRQSEETSQSARKETQRPGDDKRVKSQSRKTETKRRRSSSSPRRQSEEYRPTTSRRAFTDSFFNDDARQQQQLEKSWGDADRGIR